MQKQGKVSNAKEIIWKMQNLPSQNCDVDGNSNDSIKIHSKPHMAIWCNNLQSMAYGLTGLNSVVTLLDMVSTSNWIWYGIY